MREQKSRKDYSEGELDVINHILNARNEEDVAKAKEFFSLAISYSEKILKTSTIAPSLYLESMSELASVEYDIAKRAAIWEKLFKKTIHFMNTYSENEDTIEQCVDIIVRYIQERYISKDNQALNRALSIVKGKLDFLIKRKGSNNASSLLIKKAAILRNSSSFQITREAEKLMLTQAIRCVEKSIENSEHSWYSYLELGHCYWRSSIYEKKSKAFNEKIEKAEIAFLSSQHLKCTIQNTLALCLLYKETYQTSPFLAAYKTYERIEKNRRQYLQNSHYLAEIVMSMYYSNFPEEILTEYVTKADVLLNDAIQAGYNNARIITSLAFIKAIKGEVSVGNFILKTLKVTSSSTFDWNTIVKDIEIIKDSDDLFSHGFVLGIDEASTWNKLGTFAITFLNDVELGIRMYKVALHFNRNNRVALTNIARALLKTEIDESTIEEAEYYISEAERCSSLRFQWWREVKSNVQKARDEFYSTSTPVTPKKKYDFGKIQDLHKCFLNMKEMDNPQNRGFEFERLIASYFKISLGNSIGSHRIKSITNNQVDAAFIFDKDYYRVEAKWTKNKTDHTDVASFYFKLRTVGVTGLLISINGFTQGAIDHARSLKNEVKILLMDGDEIEKTLKGSPTFDEAIRLKQLHFHFEDNPYFQITGDEKILE